MKDRGKRAGGSGLGQRLSNNEAFLGYLFLAPALVFLGVLIAYPVLSALRQSFFNTNYLTGTDRFIGLENYAAIFRDATFWKALRVDAIWTVLSVAFQMLLGMLAALLVQRDTVGNKVIRSVLLTSYVIPIISLTLLFKWMLNDTYGILTSYLVKAGALKAGDSLLASTKWALPTVIAVNVLRSFPFCMINYLGAIQSVSTDQYEAAMIDGANGWQKFFYVTLPSLKAVTLSMLVLRTIWEFNSFDMIYLMTEGGPAQATQHLPILIYTQSVGMFNFGKASSISVVMGVILAVMVVLFNKVFMGKERVRG